MTCKYLNYSSIFLFPFLLSVVLLVFAVPVGITSSAVGLKKVNYQEKKTDA